jgi:hypothetical protein
VVVRKLSRLQKQILLNMLQLIRQHEKDGGDFAEIVRYRRVPLLCLRGEDAPKPRADSAAFSRAVRRLEARGLVLRINRTRGDPATGRIRRSALEPAPRRSDCLVLTKTGEEVAELIQEAVNGRNTKS